MEKKVVKKTVLKEEELVKVVGGKAAVAGICGRGWDISKLRNLLKKHR